MNIESPESALLNAFIANFNSLILLHLPPLYPIHPHQVVEVLGCHTCKPGHTRLL